MSPRPQHSTGPVPRFPWRILLAALAFLLPLFLYLPALRFDFVSLDDPSFAANNPLVAKGLSLPALRDAFSSSVPAAPMYIPILWVSYMIDVSLFGHHPWAFHLGNILLHASSSLLLFLLLRRLAALFAPRPPPLPSAPHPLSPPLCCLPSVSCRPSPPFPSLLLALLWSLHPLRVESIAWIAERKDCLAAFFCLLTLHAWLSALGAHSTCQRLSHFLSALLFFALGLLSKPSLVFLPLFLSLLAFSFPPPSCPRHLSLVTRLSSLVSLLPFALLAVLAALATTRAHAQFTFLSPPPLLSRLATLPSVLLFYLSKTLLPVHLSVIYPQWTSPPWLGVLLAIPFLAAAFCLLKRRQSHPLPFLGAAFALLAILPVSGILPVAYNLVADRYTLLPAIGFSVALLHLFLPEERGRPARDGAPGTAPPSVCLFSSRRFWGGCLAVAVAACAAATALHLPVWRDAPSLFLPVRRLLPDHFTVRAFDARAARQYGLFKASRECAARAYALVPDYDLFLADIPNVYALDGPQAALDLLADTPPPPCSRTHWAALAASIQLDLDAPADALATAYGALSVAPPADFFRKILFNVAALASLRLGDAPSALAFAKRGGIVPSDASILAPGHFVPYYVFLWNNDFKPIALRNFRALAASDPTPSILNNVAWLLASSPYSPAPPSEAVSYAQRALSLVPPSSPLRPTILDTLSVALANAADFPAAIDALSSAIALLPTSSPALPAMRRRLVLYQHALPYRELLGSPLPPSRYAFDPHL